MYVNMNLCVHVCECNCDLIECWWLPGSSNTGQESSAPTGRKSRLFRHTSLCFSKSLSTHYQSSIILSRYLKIILVQCTFLLSQIPNPLFDLAGITCGHFLIPFWTFFGATLIGKAIIKMHIQVQVHAHA